MVANLKGQHCMDSKGKGKSVTKDKLDKRPEDLPYFWFMCTLEPHNIDVRILQERLSVNFSLKHPLLLYYVDEVSITEKEQEWSRRIG